MFANDGNITRYSCSSVCVRRQWEGDTLHLRMGLWLLFAVGVLVAD